MTTQNEQILEHLRDGNSIDPLGAKKLCGSWALSSRISEIKGKSGHPRMLRKNEVIVRQMVKSRGRSHARYSLVSSKAVAEWDRMKVKA